MSRKLKIALAVLAATTILVGTALAFNNISLTLGTTSSYDFGTLGGVQPATVQFHTFAVKPGEMIPWHFHKALSYVVLERGTLTETHFDPKSGTCGSETFSAGAAFVEQAGEVHTVANTGNNVAIITWATAFPTSDGLLQLSPQFTVGGLYPTAAPNCGSPE